MACNNCYRSGRVTKLVMQEVVGPLDFGKVQAFIFRHRLCQWCRAAETRKDGRRRKTLAWKPDDEVWAEYRKVNNEPATT